MGEGGVVVLEELEHAKARGARIARSCRPLERCLSITQPPGPRGRSALHEGRITMRVAPEAVSYINATASTRPTIATVDRLYGVRYPRGLVMVSSTSPCRTPAGRGGWPRGGVDGEGPTPRHRAPRLTSTPRVKTRSRLCPGCTSRVRHRRGVELFGFGGTRRARLSSLPRIG